MRHERPRNKRRTSSCWPRFLLQRSMKRAGRSHKLLWPGTGQMFQGEALFVGDVIEIPEPGMKETGHFRDSGHHMFKDGLPVVRLYGQSPLAFLVEHLNRMFV